MSNPWQSEFLRIAGLLLFGLVLGALFDSLTLGLLLVLLAYLAWHLYNMFRLLRWLKESKKFQPPEASGIWDHAFEQIFRLQQRNRKRKHSLRRMLKRFHKITVRCPTLPWNCVPVAMKSSGGTVQRPGIWAFSIRATAASASAT